MACCYARPLRFARLIIVCICVSSPAAAQSPLGEPEGDARAKVLAQLTEGLFAIQAWAQLLASNQLGVSWITSEPADGIVEYTQHDTGENWQKAWYSVDGLRQANGKVQRAVINNYDPTKPLRFRAQSRPIKEFKPYRTTFGEPQTSSERSLKPILRDGSVSFAIFNDVHNRIQNYPLLMAQAGGPVGFAVFNGDVLQDPQTEKEVEEHLLQPMAWFASQSIPCFFLRGNHETRGAFARHLRDYLVLPGGKYYAAMSFGPMRVVLLDTGEDKPDDNKEYSGLVDFEPYISEEIAWLKHEIASPAFREATWRVVVMHIPPDWRKDPAELWHGQRRVNEKFVPLLDQARVNAIISGHTHRAELIEPCPDKSRGFQFPVFIGGAPPPSNATLIRVDATPTKLKIARIHSDGTVQAEKSWQN